MKNERLAPFALALGLVGGLLLGSSMAAYPVAPRAERAVVATATRPPVSVGGRLAGCRAEHGLPDRDCTPGDVLAGVTATAVCQPGYSKDVRAVPEAVKERVYAAYGITRQAPGEYEVDHLISLELGGSNALGNLWPQGAEPRPGFHEKDRLENALHRRVCDGRLALSQAQREIAEDWLAAYGRYVH